jgi:purine-nucleoside phosphorylase
MKKSTGRKIEKPLIAAENLVAVGRLMELTQFNLTKAILAFLPLYGMSKKFCEKHGCPFPMSHYWDTWVREDGTILIGPIFGGPMCAAILEELSAIGVKYAIGYGASGTLDPSIPARSIMVADSGLCSDGTTKEYTHRKEVPADAGMLRMLMKIINRRGLLEIRGKVWTMDTIYREFPSKIKYWKKQGASFVNMETSPFYAVAKEKGVKAAYLSAVSDSVSSEEWSGWFENFDQAMEQMWDICLEVVEEL